MTLPDCRETSHFGAVTGLCKTNCGDHNHSFLIQNLPQSGAEAIEA